MKKYVPSPADLYKAWSVPRSNEKSHQLTIRIPYDTLIKLEAIVEMFPGRSRNEIISDFLSTSVEQFEHSLPYEYVNVTDEHIDYEDDSLVWLNEHSCQREIGPRMEFKMITKRIQNDHRGRLEESEKSHKEQEIATYEDKA